MAAMRINEDSMVLDLGPGFSLNVQIPFDVPPGTTPAAVVLHDSMLSNGVSTMVPPHIQAGTRVIIMTEDGSYVERAKD